MEEKTLQTVQQKAYKYFIMGLNTKEVAKLLDLSPRTVERYARVGKWRKDKNLKPLAEQIRALKNAGKSYAKIAQRLGVSKTTVYNYMKRDKAEE